MSSNSYDFTLGAAVGASQLLNVTGSRLSLISASGGMVEVTTDNGKKYKLLEGQGFAFPAGKTFNWVSIRNTQAAANLGTVFIGSFVV